MVKHCIYLTLLLAAGSSAPAQMHRTIDSLRGLLSSASDDSVKATRLLSVSYAFNNVSADSALFYAREAAEVAGGSRWQRGQVQALTQLGLASASLYRHKAADSCYKKALNLYVGIKDTGGMASVLANRSLLLKVQGDYPGALADAFRSLALFEQLSDTARRAIVLENIGTIYLRQKDFDKTIAYYKQAFDLYKAAGMKAGYARNIGNMGIVQNEKGDYQSALRSLSQALQLHEELGNQHSAQINHANLGITYANLKQHELALAHHLKALGISKKLGDRSSVAVNLGNAGEVYLQLAKSGAGSGKYALQAVLFLREAVEICREIGFAGPFIEFSGYLSDALEFAGRHREALAVYKEYSRAEDSIYSEEARLKIIDLERRREKEIGERDIRLNAQKVEIERLQLANKRNERVLFGVCIASLLVLLALLYRIYRLNAMRHRKTLSDIAHIQSHEVRAPLARILGLVSLIAREKSPAGKEELCSYLGKAAEELDQVIRKTVKISAS